MSSALSGHAMTFPPLPPLPPFPTTTTNDTLHKSASPSTYVSALPSTSTTARVRPQRSRVSFRDQVDVPHDHHRRRPRSHGPPSPLLAPARRPSVDTEATVNRAASARLVLTRSSSSSTPLGPSRRASDSTTRVSSSRYDAFDAFRPQTLRYPRVSPALSRLSDSGLSLGGADTWSAGSMQRKHATISATTSKLTASLSMSSSSTMADTGAVPKDQEPGRDNRASLQATPARMARKPRSPIPSWSSTCPSLSSSSHRASVASTLTAPSMTSLLLSPQSPIDKYLPPMPTHSFAEDGVPESAMTAKDDDGELSEDCRVPALPAPLEGGGFSAKRTSCRSGSAGGSRVSAYQRDMGHSHASGPRLHAPVRLRPRHSEPASFGSSAPSSYIVPRASERLLRLQNSLADLRMQRRASAKDDSSTMQRARPKQSASRDPPRSGSHRASTPDTPATLDTPSSVRTSSIRLSRVPSPTFAELARARPGREDDALADSGDESDLDLTLPSLNAALRSRVIPSSSRLLVKMTQPSGAGSTYDDDDHDGLGWSGSESEEEEFSRTVSRIARRKSTIPAPRQLFKRPSLPAGYLHRHSDYYGSMASNQTSPSTASESHVGGPPTPTVGQRPSTSLDTSHPNQGTAALLSALVEQKYASRDALPRPKRFVQGWGAPEVLLEDDWPPDNLVASDDMAMSEYDSSTINVTAPTIPKQAVPASTRLPQPLGAAW